jgi:hypothetical protein
VSYTLEFSLKAVCQIEALYEYIAAEASPLVAKRYTVGPAKPLQPA